MTGSVLEGLPPLADFQKMDGLADTFSSLRSWVRRVSNHGELAQAGHFLDTEYRRSIFAFLYRVAENTLRQKLAKEVLTTLTGMEEWCRDGAVDLEKREHAQRPVVGPPRGLPADTTVASMRRPLVGAAASGYPVPATAADRSKDVKFGSQTQAPRLPEQSALNDVGVDCRETFLDLRAWIRAQLPDGINPAGRSLDASYRRSIFAFLCSVPARKPIFRNQVRELLRLLIDSPDWGCDGTISDAALAAALGSAMPESREVLRKRLSPELRAVDRTEKLDNISKRDMLGHATIAPTTPGVVVATTVSLAPTVEPVQHEVKEEEKGGEEVDVLKGLPPSADFEEGSRSDAGDTFKDFRKWARKSAVWDLATAGGQLAPAVRHNIFRFLMKIHERQLYRNQAREMLSMLLCIDDWTDGNVADEEAVCELLDKDTRRLAPKPWMASLPAPAPAPGKRPLPPEHLPARTPSPLPAPIGPPLPSPKLEGPKRLLEPAAPPFVHVRDGLRARVEAVLASGSHGDKGNLVRLYKESGLGGAASLSATCGDAEALSSILVIAGQRLRDLFIDPLQSVSRNARVHFPHLYIDLQKKHVFRMPQQVQAAVERKIRSGERWTCIEKSHVLRARHEWTIQYIIAYALARAKAEGRAGGVWIPLGMNTGAQGHANAVCLQAFGGGSIKAFVYDPNYNAGQDHWVHAQKAVNDALPGVRRILEGTGIVLAAGPATLFGHSLQTALGTTSTHQSWFSRTTVTTHRGYPICGAVVHFLAVVWLAAAQQAGGRLDSIVEIEQELSDVASSASGKVIVQQYIAGMLQALSNRLSERGAEPFASSMRRRLDRDRREWPSQFTKVSGSITASIERHERFSYTW